MARVRELVASNRVDRAGKRQTVQVYVNIVAGFNLRGVDGSSWLVVDVRRLCGKGRRCTP
jgi:hypothetical protein